MEVLLKVVQIYSGTNLAGGKATTQSSVRNHDKMMAYENHTSAGKMIAVRLQGPAANPTGVGARVTVHRIEGPSQTAEMAGASGYLSQSSPVLTFGLGTEERPRSITVRWPDGQEKIYESDLAGPLITLQP